MKNSGKTGSVAEGDQIQGKRRARPVAELLEGRQLLSTITVNTTGDASGADGSSTLSLRQAIEISDGTLAIGSLTQAQSALVAGALSSPNIIDFAIPGTGPFVIAPNSALPAITKPTIIDGYSQAGAQPNTAGTLQGKNAVLQIELDGTNSQGASGLSIQAGQSTVRGLAIGGFSVGISLESEANLIAGNFIGTDVSGTLAKPNGVGIEGLLSVNNSETIGGTNAGDGNLISGNGGVGIETIEGDLIEGNFIGTDITGTRALGNGGGADSFPGSELATIGGTTPGAGNLISGNAGGGLAVQDLSVVLGNRIGTDVTGTKAIPNGGDGVFGGGGDDTIGGTAAGAGNIISGNTGNGISLQLGGYLIQGNFIGTDITGSQPIPNQLIGIAAIPNSYVGYTYNDTIGGIEPGARNVISGNGGAGVTLGDDSQLVGNFIGTDATGTHAIPNGGDGVDVLGVGNSVGASPPGAGNVISGNVGNGLVVDNAILAEGNLIGTDASATHVLPNGGSGIVDNSGSSTIGGTITGAGNVISGNGGDGLVIAGARSGLTQVVANELVQGNAIGTDPTGTIPLRNVGDGINASNNFGINTIGGSAAGAGNLIAFNGGSGISVTYNSFTGEHDSGLISRNSIFANGNLGISLPYGTGVALPYPVLTSATTTGTTTTIAATLDSAPSTSYSIEFFANPSPDPSGFGQGKTYLGSVVATTDASGHASFTFASNLGLLGQAISATAIDPVGNTSSFARDIVVTQATTLDLIGSTNIVTQGHTTTFAAILGANAGAIAGGQVNFLEDGVVIGSAPLSSAGVAVFITDQLSPGTHAITASYAGDSANAASLSNAVPVGVFAPLAFAGPSVTAAVFAGTHSVSIAFNRGLLPSPAQDPSNYSIVGPGHHRIKVELAAYNPATATVTLATLQKLDPNQSYRLTIDGTKGDRIVDVFGIPLNGQSHGKPGHNFVGPIEKAPIVKVTHAAAPKPKIAAKPKPRHG